MRPAGIIALAWIGAASAAPPSLDYLFPAGGQRGTSVAVTATGKFDAWPVQAWADSLAIHISAGKDKGSLTFQIDPAAPIGPHLIRLYTADGATALRCFVIGDVPEILEAEPNDEPRTAQKPAALPVTINGQLDKSGDVDCYAVDLDAGAQLVASLQGRRLGSPIDPMFHLIDPNGVECAFAHDGLGLDPLLAYRAEKAGRYVVRVSAFVYPPAGDVRLAGAKGDIYRLSLTTGPFARFCLPSGVGRKNQSRLSLLGWNLPLSGAGSDVTVDPSRCSPTDHSLNVPTSGGDGWLRAELSDAPEWLDRDARKSGAILPVPVNVSGRIASPNEEHRFPFTAKKDELLHFVVRAVSLNSPLHGLLRIENAEGKLLAGNSGEASDPALDWAAGADGRFFVVLSDLFHKGGPDFVYRLEIQLGASPTVVATVDNHAYALTPGKTVAVKLNVNRKDGHTGGLVAVATGLPEGVTATSAEVPAKGGDVTLTLTAAATAKPANGIVRLMVLGTDPNQPQAYGASYKLRQEKDPTQELIEYTEAAWLTVVPLPPTTAPTTAPTTKSTP